MSDTSRIRAELTEAQFEVQVIEAIDLEGAFPNGDSIIDRVLEMNLAQSTRAPWAADLVAV